MANDNMNVVDRIRSGWGRFFSRENGRVTETKYIPQSRFFSPSELKELEKKEELNPMEKRALEYGKIAAMQSNRSNIEYVPVLFDGTTLVAWKDGEESPLADFRAKMMNDELEREGYQLSKELEQSILEEQGKALVDKLFIREGEEYIKVDSYSGDKEPSLSFTSYNIDTMESVNIPYDVRLFQEMLGREEMKEAETYNVLDFDKKLQTLRESQNLLQDTVKFIEESKIYKGKLDISESHEYSSLGDYSSHSWSYGAGNIEFYGYFEEDGDAIQTKVIDSKSAYHYRELLREVSDAVQREKVLNDVNAIKQALGKEPIQGDPQIAYLISQKDNLLKELLEAIDTTSSKAQGLSNTELEHRKDEAAFLKLNKTLNAVTGSYDKSEKMLEDYEKSNDIHDSDISNMAKRMNSVAKYIDTLKDTRIPMSGDFQKHLPDYHHLRELYSKSESSAEELHGYSHSVGAEEEYERLKVNYNNASDAFKKELTNILDYYENLMNLNGETIHKNVQGLEYYDKRSLKNYILEEVTEKFVIGFEGDEITRVNDLEIHGSRGRGTARPDSDLDVVVEYEGSLREDDAFNFLNEDPLIYDGIKVDVNPIRKQETGTLQDYMVKSRRYDQQILMQLGVDNANKAEAEKKIRFSRVSTDIESLDTEYINAVKSGDMKKAQQMVNAAAAIAGYNSSSSYQGTSAFNGAAPYGNGYFNSPEERKQAWDADPEHLEYEGDQTLGDYIKNGIDVNNLSFIALDPRNLRAADNYRREAIENIRQAIQSKSDTITMYRSVPSDVKEGSFRNGDWVTPSYGYAVDNASVHGWGDNYRIIEQKVSVDEIWWDGNDIAEWGYGNEQDYVQDKDYAYKNTKNNRKSLDTVTYDNDGNIIPLSKRFNEAVDDVRYQRSGQTVSPTKMEAELRDTLIGKLRSAGIDVITDVEEGQRVLDSYNKDARHHVAYHGSQASFDKFDYSFMGSGEGAQAYGWGTYVSEVEGIAKAYAKQNARKHKGEDFAKAEQAYEKAKSKYDDTVRKIADTELEIKMFYEPTFERTKELLDKAISNNSTDLIKRFTERVKETENDLNEAQQKLDNFKSHIDEYYNSMVDAKKKYDSMEKPKRNLYSVDIPDDTGRNYIGWDEPLGATKIMRLPKVFKAYGWEHKKIEVYGRKFDRFTKYANGKEIDGMIQLELSTTGSELYKELTSDLGSDKTASEFLSKAGFVGVKVIAQRNTGGNKEGKMNYVIFKEEDLKIKNHIRFFKDKEGTSYGFTVNDKIYVDPRIATAETPIHEYSHLWATAIQKANPKEWENIVGLMKNTSIWNEVKANYKDLHTDNEIADEVLATYSGRAGAEKLRKMVSDSNSEEVSAIKKASIKRDVFFLESALKKFWQAMASFLGIHYESAEQVADQVLKDMLNEVNPAKKLKEFTVSRDNLYQEYVENGNMEKAFELVNEEASMKLAENPMPEVTDAYSVSHEQEPEATIKVYKVFTLDKDGDPSALFVSGKDKLPMGVWLNAQDTWHFTAANGKDYVPSTRNPNGRGSKTGSSVLIPNEQVRQELIQRGFLPEGSKAKYITALAYRPGWHAADLPYFPQGGKQDPESNYGNVHRANQVVFECELSASRDYTETARNQPKAYNSEGKFVARNADLQYMPKNGYYQYTTNQFLKDEDKGHWYIGGAIKINRALTQEECDTILKENGKAVQEWENDILDLKKLNYATISSKIKPVLAPVMYDETGKMIPLSRRFEDSRTTNNEPRRMFIGTIGAANIDKAEDKKNGEMSYRLKMLELARTMDMNGHDAKDIKYSTGWELGVDNNWRYELPDIKRIDLVGNLLFEEKNPDYKRYVELIAKQNEHDFNEGEALRPSEDAELDLLSEKFDDLFDGVDFKIDDNTTLAAYVDAPEIYKAYPELKDVQVKFKPLDDDTIAFYKQPQIGEDFYHIDLDDLAGMGTIIVNSNKCNRFMDSDNFRGVFAHEMQHVIQRIEGFARGGNPDSVRNQLEKIVNENQTQADLLSRELKKYTTMKIAAFNLDRYKELIKSDDKVLKNTAVGYYETATHLVQINPKSQVKYNWEQFGEVSINEIAESGYHVDETIQELHRLAEEQKDSLPLGSKESLDLVNKLNTALENQTDYELYYALAGEVEARNVSSRTEMTPLQRKHSLAVETEDVPRNDQIVIKHSSERLYMSLMPPTIGRWHTADTEKREACEGYANLISKAIKCNLVWNDDSVGKAFNLNGQPFGIGDSYILSLHCNKKGYNTPIFASEQEVRMLNIKVWEKTEPFSLIKNGEVKMLYNIEDLSSFPQRFEIIKQIEDREAMKKAKANALSVFPVGKYPELGINAVKDDVQLDYNERRDLAKNLLDISRGTMPDSYEAKSKETLVRCVAMGMLGNLYEFQYSEKVPGSNGLIARLERDPAFSKEILDKASASAAKVSTFVEENVRSFGEDKKLDLRSLTPIDMDVDGNGIVESQENLAADKKQGEDEPASQSQDTSHKHKGRVV